MNIVGSVAASALLRRILNRSTGVAGVTGYIFMRAREREISEVVIKTPETPVVGVVALLTALAQSSLVLVLGFMT